MSGLPLPLTALIVLGSLALLIVSADVAIGRAIHIARRLRLSPLIVGTTLVAMSTSLAELAVNLAVTLSGGNNDIVVGNVFGSNLVNIGLGLGIPAIMIAIGTASVVIEREILLYFAVTALFTGFALAGPISRVEGAILCGSFLLILYLIYQYAVREQRSTEAEAPAADEAESSLLRDVLIAFGGLVALVVAAEVLAESVASLARAAGVSSYIISLTVVGIGTSLPEIVTSIQAARRGQIDLVLGNVFGSNVFNICFALGLPALIRTVHVPATAKQDIYFINVYGMIVAFLVLGEYPLLGEHREIGRAGGVLLIVLYLGYLGWKIAVA